MCSLGFVFTGLPASLVAQERAPGFHQDSELGLVSASGNNEVFTLSGKSSSRYVSDRDSYILKARYLQSSSGGVENALQWGASLRYERVLDGGYSGFIGQLLESNLYQGILQRYASDLGGQVRIFQENQFRWLAEAGYRWMRENAPGGFKERSLGRLFSEVEKAWSTSATLKFNLEYLPNFSRSSAYQLNSTASITSMLNDVFSLKTGFDFRYNNEPPVSARSKLDRVFTTALVASW